MRALLIGARCRGRDREATATTLIAHTLRGLRRGRQSSAYAGTPGCARTIVLCFSGAAPTRSCRRGSASGATGRGRIACSRGCSAGTSRCAIGASRGSPALAGCTQAPTRFLFGATFDFIFLTAAFVFLALARFGGLALDLFAGFALSTQLGFLNGAATVLFLTPLCFGQRLQARIALVIGKGAQHHARSAALSAWSVAGTRAGTSARPANHTALRSGRGANRRRSRRCPCGRTRLARSRRIGCAVRRLLARRFRGHAPALRRDGFPGGHADGCGCDR